VARKIRHLRDAVALVLVAGCAGGAWANRLDKTACADLSAEVSSLLASGLKEDMDMGPAWGAANLSLERLVAINRVIDLQGQLEFRCASGKVAKSPTETASPDKATTSKTSTAKSSGEAGDETPSMPTQKANPVRGKRGSAAKSLELSPVAPATASQAAASPAPAASPTPNSPPPQGERTSATSPSAASPPQPTTIAPTSTAPKAASTTPTTTPPPAPTNVAATPAVQKSAARKKSSRRDGRAYVSPKEANPFSLLLGN
jgi:hypothetical protein